MIFVHRTETFDYFNFKSYQVKEHQYKNSVIELKVYIFNVTLISKNTLTLFLPIVIN